MDGIENMLHYKGGHYIKYEDISQSNKKNILRSFMFIKQKFFPNGNVDKLNARLVADGSKQGRDLYDFICHSVVTSCISTIQRSILPLLNSFHLHFDYFPSWEKHSLMASPFIVKN